MVNKRKGIIRHEALYPLSHHHHRALFVAMNLKRAGTEKSRYSLEETIEDAASFWDPCGIKHFRDEEEVLLPAFSQYASIKRNEIKEMLIEHVEIRALFDLLLKKEDASAALLNQLGVKLEAHVRNEERVIFPMIEQALPEEKLQQLSSYFHGRREK
ncbi:hemerythrin domain-containing protein [Alteribacillus bidgolensis]|uniref:Hemerythrin HHE cation binding domain-containing protein n=1 Tax=Alteribacillus bidgolensis TaxID=930129 RepID=A0A1G8CNQ9_9BACI|nr:hemerythrin domain-containing protein [Alteribacillus bidgolensis]SDH47024.1 Hemerythrin HHE cation binding domain-containing protein [Alteribacillus bidgolensis]